MPPKKVEPKKEEPKVEEKSKGYCYTEDAKNAKGKEEPKKDGKGSI